MRGEIIGVRLAIALDVGQAVRGVRVGPPVVAIGIKIMRPALAQLGARGRDGDRHLLQGDIGGVEDAVVINPRDIQRCRCRHGRYCWGGQCGHEAQE